MCTRANVLRILVVTDPRNRPLTFLVACDPLGHCNLLEHTCAQVDKELHQHLMFTLSPPLEPSFFVMPWLLTLCSQVSVLREHLICYLKKDIIIVVHQNILVISSLLIVCYNGTVSCFDCLCVRVGDELALISAHEGLCCSGKPACKSKNKPISRESFLAITGCGCGESAADMGCLLYWLVRRPSLCLLFDGLDLRFYFWRACVFFYLLVFAIAHIVIFAGLRVFAFALV